MRQRLLLTFMSITAFVLMVLMIPLGVVHQQTERDNLTRRIERDAVATSAIAADVLRAPTGSSRSRLAEFLARYTSRTGARVVIVDRSGASIIDTERSDLDRSFASRPEFQRALDGRIAAGERSSTTLGYRLMYVAVPVSSNGAIRGAVRISYPARELQSRIRNYWLVLAGASLAILMVVAALGAVIASWVARPLNRLAQTAVDVGEGHLEARAIETEGPPEVRDLARSFNASVAALEELVLEQRDFVADASHQLRTPLHALHLRLDNARAHVEDLSGSPDSERALADIDAAYRDVTRLSALVESLLMLERADRTETGTLQPIDVRSILADRRDDWSTIAASVSARIAITTPDEAIVALGNRLHMEQVLDNLVENAIAASPADAEVRVTAYGQSSGVVIEVSDAGPGMSEAEIAAAFRRFHSSASAPTPGAIGGFGLGLAIVERLVERDRASVVLARNEGGGLTARVEYLAAPT